jgi:hypothetical protein
MLMQCFGKLPLIDADPPSPLFESEKYRELEPGTYEIERITNPCGHGVGDDWYVLRGTKIGLPVAELEKRVRYGPDSQLGVVIHRAEPTVPPAEESQQPFGDYRSLEPGVMLVPAAWPVWTWFRDLFERLRPNRS